MLVRLRSDAASTPSRRRSPARAGPVVTVTSSLVLRRRPGSRPAATSLARTRSMAPCAYRRGWTGLHPKPHGQHAQRDARGRRPLVRGTLLLVEVARLPQQTRAPQALWLWWQTPQEGDAVP